MMFGKLLSPGRALGKRDLPKLVIAVDPQTIMPPSPVR
jgi:hypothetical protein